MMQEPLGGRYRLLDLIGEGGMALVYRAEDTLLHRTVVIKMLREQYASDPGFVARFEQEARAAAGLGHPHIVAIYDLARDDGRTYIMMEYVPGPSVKDLLRAGPLPAGQAVTIAAQVCSALGYAHQAGIVHRDVKPQNILLAAAPSAGGDIVAKLADFGIAGALGETAQTHPGEVLGTVQYISPEQARGEPVGPASDVYSAGAVLYEMLAGAPPFDGETPAAIARKHVEEAPPPLSEANPLVPARLDAIVRKALAKYPAERFASAEEMAESLRRYHDFGEQRTGAIPMTAAAGPPPPPVRPQRATLEDVEERPLRGGLDWLFFLMGVVLVALLVGLGVLGFAVYRSYSGEEATPTATAVPLLAVPGVEGMEKDAARELLEKQGFVYQELAAEFSDTIPVDTVIRQAPAKGTQTAPGSTVSVVISRGPEKARVPNVVGVRLDEAKLRLEQEGLKANSVTEFSSEAAAGIVMEQTPAANTQVAPGATVTLTVSKGPEPTPTASNMTTMPDVVGLKEDKARGRLADAGIVLHDYDVNYQGRGDLPDDVLEMVCVGCVLSQTPAPGTPIPIGYDEAKIAVRRN